MTSYTVTTAVNIDSLASKTGDDIYNINGGYLTIDQDSRYGQNANTSGITLNISLSVTLGGTVEFNSTKVRLIPFDSGTGNVPAYNTLISRAGAEGLLIGVYANLTSAPTTPGSAMPSSGYIKIKQWNSVTFTTGALTGIAASATAADRAGWLEIINVNTGTMSVNRLNKFIVRGDWFDLGTTSGNNAGAYQLPTNGSNLYVPAIQVETAPGSDEYEWYPNAAGITAAAGNLLTNDIGKVFWMDTSGVVRFQSDGTNTGAGYLPESGCKIRVPNIFFLECLTGSKTTNSAPNVTLANRPKFSTTGSGVIDIDKGSFEWYLTFSTPYSVRITDSGIFDAMTISNAGSEFLYERVCVGTSAASVAYVPLFATFVTFGGKIKDCVFCKAALASTLVSISGATGLTIQGSKFFGLVNRATSSNIQSLTISNCADVLIEDSLFVGLPLIFNTGNNYRVFNVTYADSVAPGAANWRLGATSFILLNAAGISNVLIDGVSIHSDNQGPNQSIVNFSAANVSNVRIRNIGTQDNPIQFAGPKMSATLVRSGATGTFTCSNHGLIPGDTVSIITTSTPAVSSAQQGSSYTVLSVTDNDTFVCTVGDTGGTGPANVTIRRTSTGKVISYQSANSMSFDHRFQRIYTEGAYQQALITLFDNTCSNIIFENCHLGTIVPIPLFTQFAVNNTVLRGVSHNRVVPTTRQGAYGTHYGHFYTAPAGVGGWRSATWTRSGSTMTVTCPDHGLMSAQPYYTRNSSAQAAAPNGVKTSVTVTGKDAFTFTGANTGATSGTMEVLIIDSWVQIFLEEPTPATASQVYIPPTSNAAFTSAGTLVVPRVGDSIEITMPDYFLGITGFEEVQAYTAGSVVTSHDLFYALDKNDGAGFGAFKNLHYNRAGASGSASAYTFTVTDATGIEVGDYVYGTGVASECKVVSIAGNTVTVDKPNQLTVTGILSFNHISNEIVDAEKGLKLKTKIVCNTAVTSAINAIYIPAKSTALSRSYLYPLDLAELSLTGIVPGSDIVILEPGTDNEYANIDANGSPLYIFSYDAGEVSAVDIGVFKAGYVPFYIRNLSVSASGGSVLIAQIPDRNYVD